MKNIVEKLLPFKSRYRLLKGNNFSTITMTESESNIHAVMKNIIFFAKFTLTPLDVTLVNLRGREHKLPRDFLADV